MIRASFALAASALALAACSHPQFPAAEQYGANPRLPQPQLYLFPPMGLPKVVGWGADQTPKVPAGFTIEAVARNLHGPRNILPLANGDILVVESGGPGVEPVLRPKDIVFQWTIGRVHGKTKPGNRVLLLRDTDGDGVADAQSVLIPKLKSPFGIELIGNQLYVAATDAIWRYPFTVGATSVGPGTILTALPGGPIDHHWTKDIVASPDGTKLYAGVGSNSNIVENGFEAEHGRAAIWEVRTDDGAKRLYATGLRNPNGLSFYPGSNTLFTVVNERDELGNNLVPDYLTSVRDGGFYGWPYSYYGGHVDARVRPHDPKLVARAISPDYALGPHVAALGLAFASGGQFPARYRGGAFVAEHGSWDRTVLNGYQVAFVPFANGKPTGKPEPFVTGFVADGKARGRPVSVAFAPDGSLLIADDTGDAVWRVRAASSGAPQPATVR